MCPRAEDAVLSNTLVSFCPEKDVATFQSQQPPSAPRLRPAVTSFTDVPELLLPPPLEVDSDLYDEHGFLFTTKGIHSVLDEALKENPVRRMPPASPRLGPQPWPLQYEDIPDLWLPRCNSKHVDFFDASDDGGISSGDEDICEAGSNLEPGVSQPREQLVELVDDTSFVLDNCLGNVACQPIHADNVPQTSKSAIAFSIPSTMVRG